MFVGKSEIESENEKNQPFENYSFKVDFDLEIIIREVLMFPSILAFFIFQKNIQ
ncbi:hypothetical protein SAMN04488514_11317 [Kriegella aquimaris]|uniref:Uncharacterized protein n=1 Tax=Kriegella aquimaris TaxID=192904 RepID=A0A1G9VB40_9FLAO|nr:hypothetical protein SAMN04488514_11317 [Kriegella aquimaris]